MKNMLQRIKGLSVASTLATGWLIALVVMFTFNWRVGYRLLPVFALGFFVYLVYMTVKAWPKRQETETKTTEETKENE
jgi:hypothetical protein